MKQNDLEQKTKDFIEKARKVHGNKYDYSKTIYEKSNSKVEIICPIHGSFFKTPKNHITCKQGCPKCSLENIILKFSSNKESFIEKARKVHGDKYDYSLVEYKNNHTKVKIICPIHGVFEQTPGNHLYGFECSKCGIVKSTKAKNKDLEFFLEKARRVHGDKYDYSLVEYKNCSSKVKIICPKHGVFMQAPDNHLNFKQGCPICAGNFLWTTDLFIEKAREIHGDKYDYSLVDYKNATSKVKIICPKHGVFEQTPAQHMSGAGCSKCAHHVSKQDIEIQNFIKSIYNGEMLCNDRAVIKPKELDVYIPEKKVAIEHTGLYFHSTKFNSDRNHLKDKAVACENLGIKLFTIYEDEWKNKKDIVKSMISNSLGLSRRIFARKTEVRKIDKSECLEFLDNNHIQGKTAVNFAYGLYFENELVSVMTFTYPRMNMGRNKKEKPFEIELSRFCNKLNISVIGGASKLLKAFINSEEGKKFKTIYSYSDNRISHGGLYKSIGFQFKENVGVNYFYTNSGSSRRIRKQRFRKSEFKKRGIDVTGKTETQLAAEEGFYKVFDCGKKLWELNINDN